MLTFFGSTSSENQPSEQTQRELQLMRGYWEALRRGAQLPHRGDVNPRGFSGMLDKVFLIERVAPGLGRFRLSGLHLHDILGMDPRGMPLTTIFEPAARTRLGEALEAVFEAQTILQLQVEAERSIGRPALSGWMQLLPLHNDIGEQKLALGCLLTQGSVGRQPRRFAISQAKQEELSGPRLVLVRNAKVPDIVQVPRQRPALRLVSSMDGKA
jgi:hypothetical protein